MWCRSRSSSRSVSPPQNLSNDSRRLHRLATTDDAPACTTCARSRRSCERADPRGGAPRVPIALLVLDLDRLKSLNDTHGHLAGAEAVRTVGRLIADQAAGRGRRVPLWRRRVRRGAAAAAKRRAPVAIAERPAGRRQWLRAGARRRALSRGNTLNQRRDRLLGDDALAGHAAAVTQAPFLIE